LLVGWQLLCQHKKKVPPCPLTRIPMLQILPICDVINYLSRECQFFFFFWIESGHAAWPILYIELLFFNPYFKLQGNMLRFCQVYHHLDTKWKTQMAELIFNFIIFFASRKWPVV
jgi:hypothetical protein